MTGGSGHPGRGPAHAARPGQRPQRRISWGAANRLVDRGDGGHNGGHGIGDLDTLLAVAAAPPSEATLDPARLEPILVAFRGAGVGARSTMPTPTRNRTRLRSPRVALVKCAAAFLVVGGSGVAAASAGMLPTSVQQIAHEYLGGVGIPAPAASEAAASNPSTTPGAAGSPTPAPDAGNGAAGSTAQLMPLCRTVAANAQNSNAQNRRVGLSSTDQAALIAAAGEPGHVKQYCATLLTLPSGGPANASQGVAPSSTLSGEPSPSASPEPAATHGNGHPAHSPSPNPHSTGR